MKTSRYSPIENKKHKLQKWKRKFWKRENEKHEVKGKSKYFYTEGSLR